MQCDCALVVILVQVKPGGGRYHLFIARDGRQIIVVQGAKGVTWLDLDTEQTDASVVFIG